MNYKLSAEILELIKKSKKILINCHKNPDPDSVGSALAMSAALKQIGKTSDIVCPTSIDAIFGFLPGFKRIRIIDFKDIDFSDYDLFISLDSSSWDYATGMDKLPDIPIINIDHHRTDTEYGIINLVDKESVSAAEVVYLIFEDWHVGIDTEIATNLLAGIIGDSGVFRFPGTSGKTLEIAGCLMKIGADKDEIIFRLCFSYEIEYFKFWGEVFKRMQIDKEAKFAWIAIPYEIFKKFGGKRDFKESAATNFLQSIKGTDFGLIMIEDEKGKLNFSLRSRSGLDVSQIALEFGGGGHRYAAGGGIKDVSFNEGVEKVLVAARKYAKKTS
jgi:bifunctional oligoribonuclease and PAP phosphatase NrnA